MIVVPFVVVAVMFLMAVMVGAMHVQYIKLYGYGIDKTGELSWASKQILKAYNKLPTDNRPYADILEVVQALDTKHNNELVDSHFTSYGYWDDGPSKEWCTHKECEYNQYKVVHRAIQEVQDAVDSREHALKLQKVEGGLAAVEQLTASLREERDLLNDVTKELTT